VQITVRGSALLRIVLLFFSSRSALLAQKRLLARYRADISIGVYSVVADEGEMANNFLVLGTLGAFGWLFINGPPSTKPAAPLDTSKVAAMASSMPAAVPTSWNSAPELRRDPVPLVRNVRTSPAPPAPVDTPAAAVEQQGQDDLDRHAAKAAVELDGYKHVSILGKASNGAWRAKAYRGATEVVLTVDGTGRVSMD
jgi:hypothetical protein